MEQSANRSNQASHVKTKQLAMLMKTFLVKQNGSKYAARNHTNITSDLMQLHGQECLPPPSQYKDLLTRCNLRNILSP